MGGKNVRTWDQAGLYFYRFNVKMEPFQNEKIRKAFAAAIDQKEITDYVTKNSEKPRHMPLYPRDLLSLTGKISAKRRQFTNSG